MISLINRICCLALLLASVSCSKSVTSPGGAGNGGGPSTPCNQQSDCSSEEVCDFHFPPTNTQKAGTCFPKCSDSNSCADNRICNPISGACEPNCLSSSDVCNLMPTGSSGATAVCTTGGYCAMVLLEGSGQCPTNFSASGGFCKFPATINLPCAGIYNGQPLQPDPITNTCAVECSTNVSNCPNVTYTPTSTGQPVTAAFACSPVSSTCVSLCTLGSSSSGCTDPIRDQCYALGYINGPGTCEKKCTSTNDCNSNSLICAEGVCQLPCSKDADCPTAGRTRCDRINNACGIPCDPSIPCANGLACSPTSATCVASCSSTNSCPSQDSIRNGCLNYVGVEGFSSFSCEIPCNGYAIGDSPPKSGGCPTSSGPYYCAYNPNKIPGFIAGFCGLQCMGPETAYNPQGTNTCSVQTKQQCISSSVCGFN